ncbi:acyl-CoA N-acyltransferase [Aspergillus steynii IBT 23096]|uniref:Acyl-CoA N-acyltransferase n=1 Tax=Aspergillus steynii IBT 23096 TaxID=1392250 RepID=A0A2I2GF75_9EURO|nr:acyl-CoA N-acyltransferase [Aspergillus steynii IBT 23096]PLB51530.1 acyl-CoA N-acyltransferase [Aspergillus steynii IBT 23096]
MTEPWKISPCNVSDAAALARNNMAAFWEDSAWAMLWPTEIQLDFLIEQSTLRLPRNLLQNHQCLRHQKAIDPVTGAVVGYARWILPADRAVAIDNSVVWAEAQVPGVSPDEERRFQEQAKSAWWRPRSDMGAMDDEIDAVRRKVFAEKAFMQLDYLAVHPERKGQGIGTALVQSGIRLADQIALPVTTIAFEAGRGIYARLGFREADRVVQDLSQFGGAGKYATYFMVRDVAAH